MAKDVTGSARAGVASSKGGGGWAQQLIRSKHAPLQRIEWISTLAEAYGWKLLGALVLVQMVLKGFVGGGGLSGMVGTPVDFMLRARQIPASNLQVYSAAVAIPWSLKPLMGCISDVLPVLGYRRLPYISLGTIGGIVGCTLIGFLPTMHLNLLLACLFLIFYQLSLSDLLSEAVYSRKVQESPTHGPDLVSFVWGGIGVGKMGAVAIVGLVISNLGAHSAYIIALPFVTMMLFIPCFNLFEEQRAAVSSFDRTAWEKDWPLFSVAIILGSGSLGLSLMSLADFDLGTKVAAAGTLATLVLVIFWFVLNPIIAKVNAFFFVQSLFAVSTHGASFFFFTDGPEEYPNGPHLSTVFYTTVIGLVSTLFSLVGMFVYNRYMKHWRYPRVLIVGNVLGAAVNLLSCVVYLRWNMIWGISDRFFVLASSAVQTAIMELSWMPGVLINSQLCPRGREATMFALLAGCHNLGMNLANYFGALLLRSLGVEPRGEVAEQAQFENLWLAALISAVGPCVPLLLLPLMIPNVTQTETIDGISDATAGSLWNRITRASTEKVPASPSHEATGENTFACTVGKRYDEELQPLQSPPEASEADI